MYQEHAKEKQQSNNSYAVYSYAQNESRKRGALWRQHGKSDSRDEALWIAEQLVKSEDVERIEIRLQCIDGTCSEIIDKTVKVIDKRSRAKSLWKTLKNLLS